ncbi:hypothetical protein SADUNF_Sadunf17G0062700 [Salix dunnii]|uniref:Uncharacterized protein n=1 Tax=Salix dunnii TaxID=1413687 RepID=A0A835MEJ8_9ROSI|nr:hypothetical protein SADUNF_Sadunf17G0062700 [Salix dunnii]
MKLVYELLHGKKTVELDLEAEFSSLALDIISPCVFNYDSVLVTKESPVINVIARSFLESKLMTSHLYLSKGPHDAHERGEILLDLLRVRSFDWSKLPTLPLEHKELLHGKKTVELDLEAELLSSTLDIIGLGVFNYDSVSVTKESPVINVIGIKIDDITFIFIQRCNSRFMHRSSWGTTQASFVGKTIGKFGLKCEKHIVYGDWLGANAKWLVDGLDGSGGHRVPFAPAIGVQLNPSIFRWLLTDIPGHEMAVGR